MILEIRPYRDDDSEQVVRVSNAAWPDHPTTVEELRFHDENEDPKCRHARFVAAEGDQMIGYGNYGQFSDMYHPRKFYLEISVTVGSYAVNTLQHGCTALIIFRRLVTGTGELVQVREVVKARH